MESINNCILRIRQPDLGVFEVILCLLRPRAPFVRHEHVQGFQTVLP
jgi:hypothetical protein